MPKTKREQLIYSLIMCSFMCIIMSAYNMILHNGLSMATLAIWIKSLIPTFIVAFIVSNFIVNGNVKKISMKLAKNKPQNTGLYISFFMVCGMVLIMGMYGTIMSSGLNSHFLFNYLTNITLCFIVALPLQMFIVKPIVNNVFNKIISIKTPTEA